ncbi:response regulator [Chitinophaga agrisoli]|uniref:Sensory/regulatory protein RpfC n=1 Tax=Chitinophaga agrisoli TaxID=2607653 RepID=A0A5B2VN62_9BACT|nr:response regulator [Chitinophaga agrisoli]KAA2240204.1 response regulator [Chitinophaga agrisoli]
MQKTPEYTGIEQVAKLAALVCKKTAAVVFVPGPHNRWFHADGREANDWEQLLCSQVAQHRPLLEIVDVLHDNRFTGHPEDRPPYRFFAGVLLEAANPEPEHVITLTNALLKKLSDPQRNDAFPELPGTAADPTTDAQQPPTPATGLPVGILAVMDPHPGALKKSQREALLAVANTALVLLRRLRTHNMPEIYEQFFSNADALMCLHDLDGALLAVNPASAAALGYTIDELENKTLYDAVLPHLQHEVDGYLALIKQHKRVKGLMHTMHKDGSPRIWLFNNVLEKNAAGEEYVLGNALDITDRHALETTLKRTREMLEEINSVARIGFWELDVPAKNMFWSRVTREIHEVPDDFVPDLATGLSFYPEGENRVIMEATVAAALQQGTAFDIEIQLLTAKGREIWVRAIGTAEFVNGVCTRLYGTVQDIDERMKTSIEMLRSRTFLAAFVEHAPAAVAMLDKDLKYIAYSNRWLEDYGLNGQNLKGRSHYEVFPGIAQEWRAIYRRCLKGVVEKKDEDIWRLRGSQREVYLKWEVRPWYLFEDEIGGIILFTQDITEARRHREELKEARKQAEQASKAKSEFLANMSHEIRTPLNGIIGFTDLLMKTSLSDNQYQYLGIVNESANVLLNIINDILDFSKIEANKLELDIGRYNLPELSSQVSDIIKYQLQQKDIEMLLNLSPQLPSFIWTDSIRLKQVLMNLLVNAVKFTEKGEIELKITPVAPLPNGHAILRFEVRDTGIGIAPAHQRTIFEAFSQADLSITKKYGGTGLGLNISNRLLALMGSRLQLESAPGKGSIFSFELPVKIEYDERQPWPKPEQLHRALVVDDNEHNRIIIHQMLLLQDISSDQAGSGAAALQLLEAGNRYDVMIIDYHMPEMDGLETIRRLREGADAAATAMPVILLHSSADDEKVIRACERYHVAQRLIKPIKLQDLRNALAGVHQQQECTRPVITANERLQHKHLKILLAEDSAINMLLAHTIIKRAMPAAVVLEAQTGAAAVEMAVADRPDLIFMDMQMPGINGYEATKQIRKAYGRALPIIALTAANLKGEKEKCLAAGMDDFLSKPFVEEDMLVMLEKWTGNGHAPAETPPVQAPANDHFNIDKVLYYLGETSPDAPAVKEVVRMITAELQQLEDGFRNTDLADRQAWYRLGHKLYGLSATTGLSVLTELGRQLEITATTMEPAALQTLADELLQELSLCQQLLQDYQ